MYVTIFYIFLLTHSALFHCSQIVRPHMRPMCCCTFSSPPIAGTHYPCSRAINTARWRLDGPYSRVNTGFLSPVNSGRLDSPCWVGGADRRLWTQPVELDCLCWQMHCRIQFSQHGPWARVLCPYPCSWAVLIGSRPTNHKIHSIFRSRHTRMCTKRGTHGI